MGTVACVTLGPSGEGEEEEEEEDEEEAMLWVVVGWVTGAAGWVP